ncbi:MAG TPA: glycosyltransferase family 4 protein [Sphingomicrobium sp.]|nr:glycosyltransferase family 4 protein [Sphingomicrobium sp.]
MNSAANNPRPVVLISANSAWNIVNFRSGLIGALSQAGFEVVAAASPDGHEERLTSAGIGFIPLEMSRSGMNPTAELRLLGRYSAIFRNVRPAAFLGFTIKPNIYGSIAARLHGVPAINNISGLGTMFLGQGWKSRLAKALYRVALARSKVVFFQNRDDREIFIKARAVSADQSRLIPGSGIDLDHYAPMPLPGGPPIFLFIGRLIADKGVREFVGAARLARVNLPDARFQILGGSDPGNRTNISFAEIDEWRSEGVVELLGETSDVRPHIAQANAVVLPSYREGLPRVLLEAAAMGRPLIASDVPGCRAIVSDGENGLLCAVRDPRSLADAMVEFAQSPPERRRAMGQAARRTAERDYGQQRVVDSYLAVLWDIAPDLRVRVP